MVELEVRCTCGETLEAKISNLSLTIEVKPCPKCLDEARGDVYDEIGIRPLTK